MYTGCSVKNTLCTNNECTFCGVCCIAFPIKSLGKDSLTVCTHLYWGDGGFRCDDYENRPPECRAFQPCVVGAMRVLDSLLCQIDLWSDEVWVTLMTGIKAGGGLDVNHPELHPLIEHFDATQIKRKDRFQELTR